VDDGTPYVLTKHREGQQIGSLEPGTKLYRLDTKQTHQVNTLTLVDRHATDSAAHRRRPQPEWRPPGGPLLRWGVALPPSGRE
jgi:hypothetical protein